MATNKTLTPTNVTIQIPEFTDQPDQRVNSNCIDKEADAINALNASSTLYYKTVTGTTNASYGYIDLDVSSSLYEVIDVRCTDTPCLWYPGSNGKWNAIPVGTKSTDDYVHPLKNTQVSLEVVYRTRQQ